MQSLSLSSTLSLAHDIASVKGKLAEVFGKYIEAFIINAKLQPLEAASCILCCEEARVEQRLLTYLEVRRL